ncbi:MAG: hypothetical protein IJM18_05590 [Clostridia bacterium]|nr:hypothetical protein [Clostridia bacterium]
MYDCSSCRITGRYDGFTTVSAGDASVGLAACGYEASAVRLPKMIAVDQKYSSGLCPGMALEKGTMFPELISEY